MKIKFKLDYCMKNFIQNWNDKNFTKNKNFLNFV